MNTINQTEKIICLEMCEETLRDKFDIPKNFTLKSCQINRVPTGDLHSDQPPSSLVLIFDFHRSQFEYEGAHKINVRETIRKEVPLNEFMKLFNVPSEYELDDWTSCMNYSLRLWFKLSH